MKRGKGAESLGKVELELLQFVDSRQPVSVGDAAVEFGSERGLARTTVQTMLQRLLEKGYLKRKQAAGVYVYSTSVPVAGVVTKLIGDFVRGVLGGSVSPLVAYLSEQQDLTEQEVAELRKVVRQLDESPSAQSSGDVRPKPNKR